MNSSTVITVTEKLKEQAAAMVSAIRRIAVLAIVIIAVDGCQSMTGETAGENINGDTFITRSVKAKLERIATLTQIGVETTLRTVHLTGLVEREALRARAAEIARSVNGVREVVNDITIQAIARTFAV